MTSLRALAVLPVAAAVALLGPAPAMAEGYTQVDAVRDVTRATFDLESDEGRSVQVPAETTTDIRRVRFDLGERKLVAVATMRAISPRVRVFAVVRTPSAAYDLVATRDGRVRVSRSSGGSSGGGTDRAERGAVCAGASLDTRRATRSYRMVVPVACLGTPRTARVGFAVARYRETADRLVVDIDDAGRTGYRDLQADIKLGKRIRRG